MKHKIIFASIPLLAAVTIFSLMIPDSFGESRIECRSQVMGDKSLTPVERHYALKTCSPSQSAISSFEQYYSEELHNECPRIAKEYSKINHIARLNDLKECDRLQEYDSSLKSEKLTKFSRTTIEYCDEKYEIYLLVGTKGIYNQAKKLADNCLNLYDAPMWNSTADDRNTQLHFYINNKINQSIKDNQDIIQKNIEKAQLANHAFFLLKSMFDEQKEKIEYLENKLQEISTVPDYSKQEFFDQNYEKCLNILYDDTVLGMEKIHALDECSKNESNIFVYDAEKTSDYSKRLVQLCENYYGVYVGYGIETYYEVMKRLPASECITMYKNPIWGYDKEDRYEVIKKFAYDRVFEYDQKYIERKDTVRDANTSATVLPALSDWYKYQKQKIEMLEDTLKSEKIPVTYEN